MRNLVALLALVCGIAQAADPAVVIAPAAGLPGRYIAKLTGPSAGKGHTDEHH